jgi:hypothetical protein
MPFDFAGYTECGRKSAQIVGADAADLAGFQLSSTASGPETL